MDELKALAGQAATELRSLRRENEILGAKVQMIEFLELVLHTRPASRSIGAAEDIAWKIDQLLAAPPPTEPE